jgi:hypothetical protein
MRVAIDPRGWSLLRKAAKRSKDSGVFWVNFYTLCLRKSGKTEQELKFFRDLGKKLNPQAFVVNENFSHKMQGVFSHVRKSRQDDYNWSNLNHGPRTSQLAELPDNVVLIMDDYYI